MPQRLSLSEVRHVAKLARLRLTDDQLEEYRGQLSSVLDHIARISELDVEGVEPMAHPSDLVNRLDADNPAPSFPAGTVLELAPAVEGEYIAVPKVLAADEGG